MRLLVRLALLIPLAGLAIPVAASEASPNRSCKPTGARVVNATDRVVVYRRRSRIVACWRPTDRRTRLDGRLQAVRVDAVNRRFVAYYRSDNDPGGHYAVLSDFIEVLDVRTGKLAVDAGTYVGAVPEQPPAALVGRIRLFDDGAAAWIANNPSEAGNPFEVNFVRPSGVPVVLGRGTDIEADSLAAGDRFLYWRRAGAAQSAPVPR